MLLLFKSLCVLKDVNALLKKKLERDLYNVQYLFIKNLLNVYYAPSIVLVLEIQQETNKNPNLMKLTF